MNDSIYILGTALSHDGSTCIMKDGKIIVAIEKERLTKIKHDGFNDDLTIQYCLNATNLEFKDIDLVVQENTYNLLHKPYEIERRGSRIIPNNIPTITISHHHAHAYSAIGTSPFDEMAVAVIDGQGTSLDQCTDLDDHACLPEEYMGSHIDKQDFWEFLSFYSYKDGKLKTLFKDVAKFHKWDREALPIAPADMMNSIGEFYDGISNYIFNKHFCEGKTMGLAPYGRNNIHYFDAFDLRDGRVFLRQDWINKFDKYKSGKYAGFYEYFQYYSDIAFWGQKQLEKAVIYSFNKLHDLCSSNNVVYAGGVALNAVLNSKLPLHTKFENFYIQPAAGDNGLAIGCCYYGWIEYFKNSKVKHSGSPYFGKTYNNDSVLEILAKKTDILTYNLHKDYIKIAAKMLSNGLTIAWFQGGSEFGPRALGNRSILADPRRKDIRNFINRKIKTREDFRPFAPSILKEELSKYFDSNVKESDYMLFVAQVKSEYASVIPGVIHKDLSARIQTVDNLISPVYYELINTFCNITGLPILLNTSLNGADMPIVETPSDVIEFFITNGNIDALIINDIIVKMR